MQRHFSLVPWISPRAGKEVDVDLQCTFTVRAYLVQKSGKVVSSPTSRVKNRTKNAVYYWSFCLKRIKDNKSAKKRERERGGMPLHSND